MQTDNRVLDEVARFFTNAAGTAQAFRAELETMLKGRLERFAAEMNLVSREEFDAVRAMASQARVENERLATRITALEAKLHVKSPPPKPRAARPRKKLAKKM